MAEITVSRDCGNAPRKALLWDLNVAFAENDTGFILESVSEDVEWTVGGDREIRGKDEFADAVAEMTDVDASALAIDHVITHDATGAVDGTVTLDGGGTYSFCDVYEFDGHTKDAKIRAMTPYVVEIED